MIAAILLAAVAIGLMVWTGTTAPAFAYAAILIAILAASAFDLPGHWRLVRRAKQLAEPELERGPSGWVVAATGRVLDRPVRLTSDALELPLGERSPRIGLVLRRAELRDIAYGPRTARGDLEHLASRADAREAARELLELGPRKLTIELEPGVARVSGLGNARIDLLASAILTLATEPLVRAHATERGDCPYCKQVVKVRDADGVFRCPTCEAVHHGDCWKEHGGCSVFGCERNPPQDRERPQRARES